MSISIHALLAESDYNTQKKNQPGKSFLSTLSLRRATCITTITICTASRFLSTLSLRRATGYGQYCIRAREISIHALLAESDYGALKHVHVEEISIHALLAESDGAAVGAIIQFKRFLSTLSLRRATPPSPF